MFGMPILLVDSVDMLPKKQSLERVKLGVRPVQKEVLLRSTTWGLTALQRLVQN